MQALCAYREDRRAARASFVLLNLLTGLSMSRLHPVSACVIHSTVLFILGKEKESDTIHHILKALFFKSTL